MRGGGGLFLRGDRAWVGVKLECRGVKLEWRGVKLEWRGVKLEWRGVNVWSDGKVRESRMRRRMGSLRCGIQFRWLCCCGCVVVVV